MAADRADRKSRKLDVERKRRAKLVAEGKCILSSTGKRPSRVVHGPPVKGRKKCRRCLDVHAKTDATAARLEREREQALGPAARELEPPRDVPFPIRIRATFEFSSRAPRM